MKKSLLEHPRFRIAIAIAGIIAVAYLVVNLLVIGGDAFVIAFSQYPSPVFSIIATGFAVSLFLSAHHGESLRRFWGMFSIGMLFWSIATIIWFIYAVILTVELPYPSPADFFWVVGYVPLGLALLARYNSLQSSPDRRQVAILLVIIAALILFIFFFVLVPIIKDFRPANLIESLLNIVYPLSDAVLLALALLVLMTYEDSKFIIPWRLIAMGLMLNAFGDLLFIYTTSQGVYYPDQRVNVISSITDFADAMSYVVLALGMYSYVLLSSGEQTVEINLSTEETSNSSILVFTDSENRVISYSDNLFSFTGNAIAPDVMGSNLADVLKTDAGVLKKLFGQINLIGHVSDVPVEGADVAGLPKTLWVSGLVVRDADGRYSGANIVLRVSLPASERQARMSEESQRMVQYILSKTGAQEKMVVHALKTYFISHMKALYMIVSQVGGISLAVNMANMVNAEAVKTGRRIKLDGLSISISEDYESKELQRDLLSALSIAKSYAIDVVGLNSVRAEMALIDTQMSGDTLSIVESQGLRAV